MRTSPWIPVVIAALVGSAACGLAIGNADLDAVRCEAEGLYGPPHCAPGQLCVSGQCSPCALAEVCGNGIDDDCDGKRDENCLDAAAQESGAGGASGAAADAAADTSGGAAGVAGATQQGGSGGEAGAAGSLGGAAGQAGGGAGPGGGAGAGGGPAGAAGGPAGAGGQPQCQANGAACNPIDDECCSKCCYVSQVLKCATLKPLGDNCTNDNQCCSGSCSLFFCSVL